MDCPRCSAELITMKLGKTEIDGCPLCGGLLLDHGELDRVAVPHDGDLEYSTLDDESFLHDDAQPLASCPRCPESTMCKVEFNIYTGIILDYCRDCRSFWLDGAELDRINNEVRKLDEAPTDGPAPPMLWFAHFIWGLPR